MLKIEVIAVGTRPPGWITEGIDEYASRITRDCRFNVTEVATASRRNDSKKVNQKDEAQAIIGKLQRGARAIALDLGGKIWSTEQLAKKLEDWSQVTSHLQFVVGGPDGLSQEVLDRVDERWSLSHLTFPHFLVRVLIAEQVYRALMLNANHPYHK